MISVVHILEPFKTGLESMSIGCVVRISCMLFYMSLIPVVTWAQTNIGYEANAYSEASVARGTSSFKFGSNPAILSSGIHWFGIQSFGMRELRDMGISVGYNSNYFNSSVEFHHFGFDLFNESKLYTGINFRISNYAIGLSFGGIQSNIKGYGRSRGIISGIGFTSEITKYLKLGGSVTDVLLWSDGDFLLDSRFSCRIGVEIGIIENTKIYTATNFIPEYDPVLSIAVESTLLNSLQIVAGYKIGLEEWSGGIKLEITRIVIYLSSRRHPFLGWSPGAGFGITW